MAEGDIATNVAEILANSPKLRKFVEAYEICQSKGHIEGTHFPYSPRSGTVLAFCERCEAPYRVLANEKDRGTLDYNKVFTV